MYKLNKVSNLNHVILRGNYMTKKVIKNVSKQTLIFLRAPKHFNIGKHKVSSFVNSRIHIYKFNFSFPTAQFIKNKFFIYRLFSLFHKMNILYTITSIRINTKLKIK